MQFGAAEDVVRAPDLPSAKAKMTMLRLAGFSSVRVTSQWQGTEAAPSAAELAILRNVAGAAQLSAVRVYLAVYPTGSRVTPLTPEARELFAAYVTALKQQLPSVKDVIVGNEPNLNRFWLPQFNPDGTDAAAPAYLALLARSYDALKAVDPTMRVWGGALAPRGIDRPGTGRDTHSPVAFLKDMGVAYRAERPDAAGDGRPRLPPLRRLVRPVARHAPSELDDDRPRRLRPPDQDARHRLRRQRRRPARPSRSSTTSSASSRRSRPGKAKAYTGAEPATTKPVDEITQGQYYGRALQLAFCQPNVTGILFFHSQDEPALASWQSGVYYADGTPKSSLYAVRDALARARGGSIARCDGLGLDVTATKVRFPTQAELRSGSRNVRFTCRLDCAWELRVASATTGAARARLTGYGRAGAPLVVSLKGRKLGTGPIRFSITLSHPVNPGVPQTRESATLSLR